MKPQTLSALKWIANIFEKHGVQYQVNGGFAAKLYGSPRPLNDIDFEISEKYFPIIMPEISEYITFGPARFKNGKWDLNLIVLNYYGQSIDIGGYETGMMTNLKRTRWIKNEGEMKSDQIVFEGMKLNIILPEELIAYKRELDGEHQAVDIEAVERYIEKHLQKQ